MNTLRSAACTVCFYVWSIFMGLIMIPMVLLPRPAFRLFVQLWSKGVFVLFRFIVGIRVEVRGREFIPAKPALIAAKHQSEWETLIFLHLLHDPVYIMKKELGYIPGYGLYARKMKMIFIDRSGHAKTLRKLVQAARKTISAGRSLVIFPQGTRIDPGIKAPYRTGIAALYSELDTPVYPVVHNAGICWPQKSFRKSAGPTPTRYPPPLEAGPARHEFMTRLEQTMEAATDELLAETARKN
jgi:1-acyl-sn-glycerol-3-phosphate acyltransferase